MVKKRVLFLVIFILIGLAYLVLALAGDGVIIVSPASGTNFTNLSAVLFNVSYINGTDISNPANATFFFNVSSTWAKIGNTSVAGGCTANSCSINITNTTIPDGAYSLNVTLYNASGSSISITNTPNLSTMIYIDATAPQVYTENITNPLTGRNYSGNLILNVSAIDVTVGISMVRFNITNSSGGQNSTVTLSREGPTTKYSLAINTSHYPDGYYNLTIYANDSVGNLNNSALIYRIIFDNTAPTITHSCDDYTVDEDELITCTCSASDSLSELNTSYGTSGRTFTANPSTSSSGNNFQTTCTSQDKASNFRTSTLYYNVSGSGSSSSSGSSSGSGSTSTSSSTNSSNNTNSSTTNQSANSGSNNTLQGNQENSGTPEINSKINIWIVVGVVVALGLGVTVYFLIRKYKIRFKTPKLK